MVDITEFIDDYNNQMSVKDILNKYNIGLTSYYKILNKADIKRRPRKADNMIKVLTAKKQQEEQEQQQQQEEDQKRRRGRPKVIKSSYEEEQIELQVNQLREDVTKNNLLRNLQDIQASSLQRQLLPTYY